MDRQKDLKKEEYSNKWFMIKLLNYWDDWQEKNDSISNSEFWGLDYVKEITDKLGERKYTETDLQDERKKTLEEVREAINQKSIELEDTNGDSRISIYHIEKIITDKLKLLKGGNENT